MKTLFSVEGLWKSWWKFLDCIYINNLVLTLRIFFLSLNSVLPGLLVYLPFSCLCSGDLFPWGEMLRGWSPAVPVFRGFSGTPLSIRWVASETILLWFGAVCLAFRGQPTLSIQTNDRVIPLGIGEHFKWATKQNPTIYSVLSIANYALQFSFNYSL